MSTIDTIGANGSPETSSTRHISRSDNGTIGMLFRWLGNAMTKRRTRIHLSELSNGLLVDIGVAPAEARQESKRFFWD